MLTIQKVKKMGACWEALKWAGPIWNGNEDKEKNVINRLMKEKRYTWVNWLIVRLMDHKHQVMYAVFAAEQVLKIFEKKYPKDKRPRKAIEAAKAWIKNPNEKNKNAAADAAAAAAAAAYAAAAAAAAAYAAYAAAADAAANAAYAAAAAADADYVAREKLQIKILKYGMNFIRQEKERIRNEE